MKKQTLKKVFLTFLIAGEVILINALPASAISVSGIAAELEARYHLNLQSIQNQGENFNVSDTKKTPPQVLLFFNPTDPKPGEKITAEALPTYFSNAKESLYYTWYLKHNECDKCDEGDCDSDDLKVCDKDDDDDIDENDWKIEAMRIITNSDFDTKKADYSDNSDNDDDGYETNWGGDDREDMPNYCYIHDFKNGINYELRDNAGADFNCPTGTTATCVEDESLVCPSDPSYTDYTVCQEAAEEPTCNATTDLAECANGTPVCTDTLDEYDCDDPPDPPADSASCANTPFGGAAPSCTVSSGSSAGENLCQHLFPEYNNFDDCLDLKGTPDDDSDDVCIDLDDEEVGDDDFKEEEEAFWKTSPQDPDTADNGNKDEANAVGLGINIFTWNYQPEDEVGVIIEGASMIPAKHDDSSMMIMWAYPKNECEVENKGEYYKNIKGYSVKIPAAEMNLNDCIEDNLIDPREGGQPEKINVSLSYSPENPLNDPTEDNMGDMIAAQATTDNASQDDSQLYYEWAVEISPNGTYNPASWTDITTKLTDNSLIPGPVKGNGLASLKLKLNLNKDNLKVSKTVFDDDYFPGGIGYLRIKTIASENFSSGVSREGKSDVIIKVISTEEKITAHGVGVDSEGKLTMDETQGNDICVKDTGKLQSVCFTIKNAIIGLKYDDPDLENFSWTLNGKSLNCNSSVSSLCSDEKQNNYNFFPATGNIGDTYAIGLTANNVTTGKTINLVRTFQIIDPFVKIISTDESIVWPKYLGDYIDLDGNYFPDNSETVFEMYEGGAPKLEAEFHPGWLADYITDGFLQLEWTVDGVKQDNFKNLVELSLPSSEKEPGSIYNISVNSVFRHPPEIRQALKNIWGISQFDTTEEYMSRNIQIEVFAPENETLTLKNSGKFLAGLLSYLPGQITFLLRILLTIVVIIATAGIVFAFMPDYENKKTYI